MPSRRARRSRRRSRKFMGSSYVLTAYNQVYVAPMSHIDFNYATLELPSDRAFSPISVHAEVTAVGDSANPSGASVIQIRGYDPDKDSNEIAFSSIRLCPTGVVTRVSMRYPPNHIWGIGSASATRPVIAIYNPCFASNYHGLGLCVNLTFRARILADVDDRTCPKQLECVFDGPPSPPTAAV